jgi:ferredoxin-type protein NapH
MLKSRIVQRFRRPVQLLVMFVITAIPWLNYYGIKISQKDDYAILDSFVLSWLHSLFSGQGRDEVIAWTHHVKGSVWTMDLWGYKISDPLAVIESTTITLYLYLPLILSLVIPVIVTVLFGKVFCGWICPMNLLLEINDKLRTLLQRTGYQTRNILFSSATKYYTLGLGLIAAFIAGRPLLALIYPPAVISRSIFYKIYNDLWGAGIWIIIGILFFELILSRRWWCRYICPGGAVYTALSRFRLLRIQRDDNHCDQCGDCVPVCPYDLKPMTRELTAVCDQCGLCIAACAPDALRYTLNRTTPQVTPQEQP